VIPSIIDPLLGFLCLARATTTATVEEGVMPEVERIAEGLQFRHLRHTMPSGLLGSGLPLSVVADTLGNRSRSPDASMPNSRWRRVEGW